MFVAVQPYRFCPAVASDLNAVAPTTQVAGSVVYVADFLGDRSIICADSVIVKKKSSKCFTVWFRSCLNLKQGCCRTCSTGFGNTARLTDLGLEWIAATLRRSI